MSEPVIISDSQRILSVYRKLHGISCQSDGTRIHTLIYSHALRGYSLPEPYNTKRQHLFPVFNIRCPAYRIISRKIDAGCLQSFLRFHISRLIYPGRLESRGVKNRMFRVRIVISQFISGTCKSLVSVIVVLLDQDHTEICVSRHLFRSDLRRLVYIVIRSNCDLMCCSVQSESF